MSAVQNFRTALGGFNREDVVRYLEYINNKHNAEISQLNTQLQNTREALDKVKSAGDSDLRGQLQAALARCEELEKQLAEEKQGKAVKTGDELEAYRRAERAERLAKERATQIYQQTNAALADVTAKVEAIYTGMTDAADQFFAQVQNAKTQLKDAVSVLYAIRPEEE